MYAGTGERRSDKMETHNISFRFILLFADLVCILFSVPLLRLVLYIDIKTYILMTMLESDRSALELFHLLCILILNS